MNTTYFLNLCSGNLFGSKKDPAIPTEYYVGVSLTEPAVDGSGVSEPTAGGYERVLISGLGEPVDGEVTNESTISWNTTTADWGVVKYYVVYGSKDADAPLLMFGSLTRQRTVEAEDMLVLPPGQLKLSVVNITSSDSGIEDGA